MATITAPSLTRIAQINDFHCGPAVIQMLLSHLGIITDQKALDKAAGITRLIYKRGSTVNNFSQMVKRTSKEVELWYKDHAQLKDIAYILDNYQLPVAIEWQGLFGYEIDPTTQQPKAINDGHYSIVTHIDQESKNVTLIDPYFVNQDRIFKYRQFRKRWWDSNKFINAKGEEVTVYDYKLFFFIAPKSIKFPAELKLKKGSDYFKSLPL